MDLAYEIYYVPTKMILLIFGIIAIFFWFTCVYEEKRNFYTPQGLVRVNIFRFIDWRNNKRHILAHVKYFITHTHVILLFYCNKYYRQAHVCAIKAAVC